MDDMEQMAELIAELESMVRAHQRELQGVGSLTVIKN
jgi:hypothetical protein